MGTADRQELGDFTEAKIQRLPDKLTLLKQHLAKLDTIETQLQKAPDKQISLTDAEARSMATSGRGTGIVGHNVQTAVDTKNPLIVVHEVTNVGHDRSQLASRMKQAKAAMGASALNVVGDRGYYSGEEIRHCHEAGITAFVPSA